MEKQSKTPLFSVVTICYNAGDLIKKTIESVLAQDFTDYEYIIQDGLSRDNTLAIVNSYKDKFSSKGISLVINSGKDGGIYDAMNKAVSAASGEYVIFMNADDCFYSENVLNSVAARLRSYGCIGMENANDKKEFPDIVFGDCIVKELGMYFMFRKCPDLIKERMPFSHQACFAKRELLLETPLNTEYRITADYDFLLKAHLAGKTFFDSDVVIALVTADGVSSVSMYDAFSEACKVCNAYGIPRYTDSEMKKKVFEMKIKQFVLDCFPSFIKKAIRKYQVTHRGQTTEVTLPSWANI